MIRAGLLLALLVGASSARATESQVVLALDIEYLQSTMPLYARIAGQAEKAASGADAQRRSELELARDLRQSEILTALPEVIAQIAGSANADLVVDRAVARRIGESAAHDITDEVEKVLVERFGDQPLEPAK
ncbi:MAG: hypothetical protein IPK27_17420 [Rhodanobacteraceae bacterium]|nr:hypothetical protein [Rhodanobacteraceae bacterium]